MAEIVLFRYRSGTSCVHRMDARMKVLSLVLMCLAAFSGRWITLVALSLLSLAVIWITAIPPLLALRDIRPVLLLAALVVGGRVLFSEQPVPGLVEGLLAGWRLVAVALLGSLFVSTTQVAEIRSAVFWTLRPLPLIPASLAARAAAMVGLSLRFVPLLLRQAREVDLAQKARGAGSRRRPVWRMAALSRILLRRMFERGDELVEAMLARCYTDEATLPRPAVGAAGVWAASAASAVAAAALLWGL